MSEKKPENKKELDPLGPLKYRGYCWAFTAPGDDTKLEEFVQFAKFYLCRVSRRLLKDPIWDEYTDEEILAEYFAHFFTQDKEAKTKFETDNFSGTAMYGEDIYEWLDKQIAKNQEEMAKKSAEQPDVVAFSPEKNVDKEE